MEFYQEQHLHIDLLKHLFDLVVFDRTFWVKNDLQRRVKIEFVQVVHYPFCSKSFDSLFLCLPKFQLAKNGTECVRSSPRFHHIYQFDSIANYRI